MSMYIRPFEVQAASQTVVVTASNQSTAIAAAGTGNRSIRIAVVGTQTVFFSLTSRAETAAVATSTPVLAGSVEVFLLRNDITHINVIAAGTGSTMYITVGESA
jgi:hypothetical protein